MSNQTMRSKKLSVEFRDRIVLSPRSREGYQKMSAALKVHKNTVTSIILKWNNQDFLDLAAWPN